MKHIITAVFLFASLSLVAQQKTSDYLGNSYLSIPLNTIEKLNNFRYLNNLHVSVEEEIKDNYAYYKFDYHGSDGSNKIAEGLIKIRCSKNDGSNITIEKNLEFFYTSFLLDDDEANYTKQIVKTTLVHGGFFFNKHRNTIDIIMRSQPNNDFAMATIEINGLSVAKKALLAKDFIEKTVFK